MSTERTEDFGWIVDLSWHGMQQGESEIVTTEEKKKENKCSQHLGTWNAEILCSQRSFYHSASIGGWLFSVSIFVDLVVAWRDGSKLQRAKMLSIGKISQPAP